MCRVAVKTFDEANITLDIEIDTKKSDFDRIRMIDFKGGQPFTLIAVTALGAAMNISWVAYDILRHTNSCPGPLLDSLAKVQFALGFFGITLCAKQEIPRNNWNKLNSECKIAASAIAINGIAMLANLWCQL